MIIKKELLDKLIGTNLYNYNKKSDDKVSDGRRQFYFDSYFPILNYLKTQKGNLNSDSTMIAMSLVYSWMPRIPHRIIINDNEVIKLLNKAYDSTSKDRLSIKEIETIKSSINNSMVGASKILHFINPCVYPIWDSNIDEKIKSESSKDKKEVLKYFNYQNVCLDISNEECTKSIENFNSEKFNGLSKLRKIDMALFSIDEPN
jgi:hypothetical protein